MPHVSILDPKAAHTVDTENWVVAMLRKPAGENPEHAFLIVEGEGPENQVIFKRYDLEVSKKYDAKDPYLSKFQISCEDKMGPFYRAEESLIELLRRGETTGKSWRILKSDAKKLHGNVLDSKNNPGEYNLLGSESMIPCIRESCHTIGGSVTEASSQAITDSVEGTPSHVFAEAAFVAKPGHNCFTWARSQLLQLGYPEIEKDLPEKISDWIASPTSRYLKHNPEPQSKMCLIL